MFSFGLFSSVWSLIANISEHSDRSIFIGEWVQSVTAVWSFVVHEQVQTILSKSWKPLLHRLKERRHLTVK
jgi:hypothetical protein